MNLHSGHYYICHWPDGSKEKVILHEAGEEQSAIIRIDARQRVYVDNGQLRKECSRKRGMPTFNEALRAATAILDCTGHGAYFLTREGHLVGAERYIPDAFPW